MKRKESIRAHRFFSKCSQNKETAHYIIVIEPVA